MLRYHRMLAVKHHWLPLRRLLGEIGFAILIEG